MILLIDNYDSFTYNIYQYLGCLGAKVKVVRNDAITVKDVARLKPEAIVLSPGPGTPDESGITLETISTYAGKIPILGVCLGHQSIGQAFGGKVIRASKLMHGKTSTIKHTSKGVFKGLPNPLEVTRYHSLIVERKSLPDCLEVTATTDDGLIMGLRHKRLLVEGVQFHPESYVTQNGMDMLKNFLDLAAKRGTKL
ncbi:MAG: aminodeoxychorismate/anthranilate synthase component II [Pseudobdellovibrionaceae bacterium]|uniref:anthranilate synthase component II n=1 Tax=Oligoflexus sp. TaxID=1971216 RepID=UPI0027C7F387|nr:aminodeoxychorismate/anthranilate synthase component II [Oligoflexus sp.]MDQ3231023.1 aminodeoxychorismate/anthranilate synthase component II [Pseudobdellovibrionaceae bacterium]HYX38858.1 aminodeoxychorismate/anthranilate synthase component II [Oligoflexus sp.]